MFDRSFLPAAKLEFVVVTDTHYMIDPGPQQLEFEMRRQQSARAEHALRRIAAVNAAFVVHLGDLVQEFPTSAQFNEATDQALAQIKQTGISTIHQIAGNHDVGDKPDPTMPTDWVTAAALAVYEHRFGLSWYAWDTADCHFIALNSQIMNGDLPAAASQQQWLEHDLATNGARPTFIFLHLAPYLVSEQEPALGHYDNIDEPARSWLLNLIKQHNVQAVFAGHSHFAFFNRIGGARSFVVPSTSFTRPGFSQVFSSGPPPSRGRDDTPKLGFFLVRIHDNDTKPRVHFIRTSGATGPVNASPEKRLVTRAPADLPHSPLGITLRHPLTSVTDVPLAWPSSIRQPVRNDYPVLALQELGVRHVRIPASDLNNELQRERLTVLKDEGLELTAFWIWSQQHNIADEISRHRDLLSGIELQIPHEVLPSTTCLETIAAIQQFSLPVTISPLLPREIIGGKQHPRTRFGYHVNELTSLNDHLARHGVVVERVLCRIEPNELAWDAVLARRSLPTLSFIGAIDWAVELAATDDQHHHTNRALEALFAVALDPDCRVFLEPLIDFDRTMDIPLGLLDRLCNPRPVFRAVQTLNTVLFSTPTMWAPAADPSHNQTRTLKLQHSTSTMELVLPEQDPVNVARANSSKATVRVVNLNTGTIRFENGTGSDHLAIDGATVLIFDEHAVDLPPKS